MVNVPRELLEAAAIGDVVPVLGDALNPGPPAGAASCDQLALLLAAKLSLPAGSIRPTKDLPSLVSQYEALRGRHALIEVLRQQMGAPDPALPPELLLAVRLAPQALITTSVSPMPRQPYAVSETRRPLSSLIRLRRGTRRKIDSLG